DAFELAAAADFADLPRDIAWIALLTLLSGVASSLEDAARAERLYDLLAPYAGRFGWNSVASFEPVDETLGTLAATLGRFDIAEQHFAAAAALCERMQAPIWLAHTKLAWARMLDRRGRDIDLERAQDIARQALVMANELGVSRIAEQAQVCFEQASRLPQVPLPTRLPAAPATGVVGRDLEEQRLLAAMKEVASGQGQRVVLLSGEPGIGKTTLAAALARQAHSDGATVLYGRCDEDFGVPYQPFVEALGGYLD